MRATTAILAVCGLAFALYPSASRADALGTDVVLRLAFEDKVRQLTAELAAFCPLADPADRQAFDRCRAALFREAMLRRTVDTILIWGRPHATPGETLKNTTLTEFAPEAWVGLNLGWS